jgi:magnesium chelatase accessory protein
MTRALDWNVQGRDWPNREASRFVDVRGLRWHVQVTGAGPPLVLLHGTGAATHSWRDVAPLLARTHQVVALDLPGHGFTATPRSNNDFTLPNVARAVGELLKALDVSPTALVGHSAGAAIAVRMALDRVCSPSAIVGINAALLPFPGPLGPLAPLLARTLFYNPFSLGLFAYRAEQRNAISDLMRSTGSTLDERGLDFYERLFRCRDHLKATVALMAHWDLETLRHDLPRLASSLTLIVGARDRAVPPTAADSVARLAQHARIVLAPGLGHLAHEEAPAVVVDMILAALHHV